MDQSPGTRSRIPVVQVKIVNVSIRINQDLNIMIKHAVIYVQIDPAFKGIDI